MPTLYEIPTSSSPQKFSITLAGIAYNLQLLYHDVNAGQFTSNLTNISTALGLDNVGTLVDPNNISSWILDISDQNNNPILVGIPLITGIDLLYQYQYLNFGGALVVSTDGDLSSVPTFGNLGTFGHLWFVTFP